LFKIKFRFFGAGSRALGDSFLVIIVLVVTGIVAIWFVMRLR
jgi:hypothetical protein